VHSFNYDDYVALCKRFAAYYNSLRGFEIRSDDSAIKFYERAADACRKIFNEQNMTIAVSPRETSLTFDNGKSWRVCKYEDVRIDWQHYSYHFAILVG
jgi:hypothetical protein